jgi:hypothetical protein
MHPCPKASVVPCTAIGSERRNVDIGAPRRRQLAVRAPELYVGIVATALVAIVVLAVLARDGWSGFLRSDGALFERVARDPFADRDALRAVEAVWGNAYRFGRPLYPVVGWILGIGDPSAVRWALLLLIPASIGVAVALAAALIRRSGRAPSEALRLLLLPAVWAASMVLVSETLVAALVLATCVLVLASRPGAARVAATLSFLAKESSAVLLVPMVVSALRRRDRADALRWTATLVPLVAWWCWVRVRIGTWPFADPSLSRRDAVGIPFAAYLRTVAHGLDRGQAVAFVIVALTVVAAVAVWSRRRGDLVAQVALAFAAVLIVLGPNAVRFPGELIRLTAPAQMVTAVAALRLSGPPDAWPA